MVSIPALSTIDWRYYKLMAVCLAGLLILFVLTFWMSEPLARFMLTEGGPIETLSAAGYLAVVVSLFRETTLDYVRRHFYFIVIPLAMCMREMGFHVEFTTVSLTKSSFYVTAESPLLEKMIVIPLVAVLLWGGYRMVRRHASGFIEGLKRLDVTPVALGLAAIFAVASKGLDGIGRKMAAYGVDVGATVEVVSLALEEILELGIPILFLIALFAYFPRPASPYADGNAR